MDQMLESAEAARRLGVKLTTLYAYVSRGLLVSHRSPDGRRSLFALDDVERLARRARTGREVETRLATVTTAVTQVRDDGPAYRGVPAVDLATTASFEAVARLLWASGPVAFDVPSVGRVPALAARDRLRWAVVMTGARDSMRSDLRPEAVWRSGAGIVASAVAALGPLGPGRVAPLRLDGGRPGDDTLAGRLAAHLVAAPSADAVRAVNAALVLLADHELASSTVAVRVAASTRADPYDAVLSGLGTIGGPLHAGASRLVHGLLADAAVRGPEPALDDALRFSGLAPGFGHALYPGGDPRATRLAELARRAAGVPARRVVDAVVEAAARQQLPPPNIDLALAALGWVLGAGSDFGETVFTVARMAGWIAHYLEELDAPALRFRARAVYAGTGRRDPDAIP